MNKMEIRQATDSDLEEIITLLKSSLGETLLPKSTEYWKWKHIDNPFGRSPVLVAIADEKIVGVRAFMRWQWESLQGIVRAVRAVDTATHREYQGQGIFRKLTSKMLTLCQDEGLHMVFNTPNHKSKPGYLKMGWQVAGKLPIHFNLMRPFAIGRRFFSKIKSSTKQGNDRQDVLRYLNDPGVPQLLKNSQTQNRQKYVTPHTQQSLIWRYSEVPVLRYHASVLHGNTLNALMIFRIKESRFGREMRIVDLFSDETCAQYELDQMVKEQAQLHSADYVTCSQLMVRTLPSVGLNFSSKSFGPVVTCRGLAMVPIDDFLHFAGWQASLGDMELF